MTASFQQPGRRRDGTDDVLTQPALVAPGCVGEPEATVTMEITASQTNRKLGDLCRLPRGVLRGVCPSDFAFHRMTPMCLGTAASDSSLRATLMHVVEHVPLAPCRLSFVSRTGRSGLPLMTAGVSRRSSQKRLLSQCENMRSSYAVTYGSSKVMKVKMRSRRSRPSSRRPDSSSKSASCAAGSTWQPPHNTGRRS